MAETNSNNNSFALLALVAVVAVVGVVGLVFMGNSARSASIMQVPASVASAQPSQDHVVSPDDAVTGAMSDDQFFNAGDGNVAGQAIEKLRVYRDEMSGGMSYGSFLSACLGHGGTWHSGVDGRNYCVRRYSNS